MKFSDFKPCSKCGGSGKIYRMFSTTPCPCKRSATEITDLKVPEGYEFDCITEYPEGVWKAWFTNPYQMNIKLPHKEGEVKTFVCEVCKDRLKECYANDHCNLEEFDNCPNCQGSPKITAKLKIEVKPTIENCPCKKRTSDNICTDKECSEPTKYQLIETWEEV